MTKSKGSLQLNLNLPINETFAEEDFLVSSSNQEAVEYIDAWPKWEGAGNPFHCLIIFGPRGCGKTHLCHVWQKISNAKNLNLAEFDIGKLAQENLTFIIDDVDRLTEDKVCCENLLHLYNWIKEQGGFLLLTAKDHPKDWQITLADLSSRMLASHAVKIKSPDDDLLQALIIKQFSDRQINLPKQVLKYLLPRVERSFDGIRKMVHDIDQLSLTEKKKITIAIVKRVLENEE